MSQHPSDMEWSSATQRDAGFGPPANKPPKGWFGRNWLWFVPLVIVLPIVVCCGGGAALVYFGLGEFEKLPPYKDSIDLVKQDPQIAAELGSPVEVPSLYGILSSGGEVNYASSNMTFEFDARIPISGPNGSAEFYIEADSSDNVKWTYTTREVVLPDGTVIDLTNPSPTPIAPGADSEADESDSSREIPDQE